MSSNLLFDLIRDLEMRLATRSVRQGAKEMLSLLSDDFIEFGASGTRYTKAEIMMMLTAETDFTPYEIEDYTLVTLGETSALATYTIPPRMGADGTKKPGSLRSSIWRLTNGRWRLLFHQGTALPRR